MLQISTKMKPKCSQKLIKWCPEASKNRSERQGRALMAERLPKLTEFWANGAKMAPRCSQNGAQKPPKLIQNPSQNWCKNRHRKNLEKYGKIHQKRCQNDQKNHPKIKLFVKPWFCEKPCFSLRKTIILRFQRAPKLMKIHSKNDTKTSFEKMMQTKTKNHQTWSQKENQKPTKNH